MHYIQYKYKITEEYSISVYSTFFRLFWGGGVKYNDLARDMEKGRPKLPTPTPIFCSLYYVDPQSNCHLAQKL